MSIEQIVTDSPGHNAGSMLEPRIRRRSAFSASSTALQSARRAGAAPSGFPSGPQPGSGFAARQVGCRTAIGLALVVFETAPEAAKVNRQPSNDPPRRTACCPAAACKHLYPRQRLNYIAISGYRSVSSSFPAASRGGLLRASKSRRPPAFRRFRIPQAARRRLWGFRRIRARSIRLTNGPLSSRRPPRGANRAAGVASGVAPDTWPAHSPAAENISHAPAWRVFPMSRARVDPS